MMVAAPTVVIIYAQSTNTLKLRNKRKICVAVAAIEFSFSDAILVRVTNQSWHFDYP